MPPTVVMVAATILFHERLAATGYQAHPYPSDVETVLSADELVEFADRVARQWHHTAGPLGTNGEYVKMVLANTARHQALEHASATFYISGVSRLAVHELLLDHRGLMVTELSQRFVNSLSARFVDPQACTGTPLLRQAFDDSLDLHETLSEDCEDSELSAEDTRDVAAAALLNCTASTLVATGSMRVWRDVINSYDSVNANAELAALSGDLLRALRGYAPNCFGDIRSSEVPESWLVEDEPWEYAA